MTVEEDYVAGNPSAQAKCRLVVISGCSGSGKSTLLAELARRGYDVVPEAGRQIVKEQLFIDGDALPWKNDTKFVELLLSRSMYLYNAVRPRSRVVFFDRSIVEPFAHFVDLSPETSAYARRAVERYRYWKTVFMTPPWEEIFANDPERPYRFADAGAEYHVLLSAYRSAGYDTVIVPRAPTNERADFIEAQLSTSR
jgi:predicted ATPase